MLIVYFQQSAFTRPTQTAYYFYEVFVLVRQQLADIFLAINVISHTTKMQNKLSILVIITSFDNFDLFSLEKNGLWSGWLLHEGAACPVYLWLGFETIQLVSFRNLYEQNYLRIKYNRKAVCSPHFRFSILTLT
jgi:hypothetical protein